MLLGSAIEGNGDCKAEITHRIALARAAMTGLSKIWKDRDISVVKKARLVMALVLPVTTHGCESWTLRKNEIKKIHAFKHWCWRRMLRIPWTARRTNVSIIEQVGQQTSLEATITKQMLSYFGHIVRSTGLEKAFMLEMGGGQRKRPRRRWLDNVQDITGLTARGKGGLQRPQQMETKSHGGARPDGTSNK